MTTASASAAGSDPFESTANPVHYVPRPATERALDELERRLRGGARCVALTGPPGLGKTLLLKVLAERLADAFEVVRLPYPALSGPELCRWVLATLGEPEGEDPEGALLDRAFRGSAAGREFVLLVDDASALPPGGARSIATLLGVAGGALRVVLAALDDARLRSVLAMLGPELAEVRLDAPMSTDETVAYLRARVGAPTGGRAARFHRDTALRIHGASGGIPRRVHELGSLVWRAAADADLPAMVEGWAREETTSDGTLPPPEPKLSPPPAPSVVSPPPEPSIASPAPSLASPAPERARRRRGRWLAVAALATVAVAAPYLHEAIESLRAGPPAAPAAPPALEEASPLRPDEVQALGPDEAPTLRPDGWAAGPAEGWGTSEGLPAPEGGAAASIDPALEGPALAEPAPAAPEAPSEPVAAVAPRAPARAAPEVATRPAPPRRARAEPETVLVNVSAIPWAVIHVDGGVIGETPLAGVPLSPGLHVFRAEFPGGRAVVRTVEISAENRHVNFE